MLQKLAIKTCEEGGTNKPCKVRAWVRNGCIAVAQGKDGSAFFGVTPPGMAEAEALKKMSKTWSFIMQNYYPRRLLNA